MCGIDPQCHILCAGDEAQQLHELVDLKLRQPFRAFHCGLRSQDIQSQACQVDEQGNYLRLSQLGANTDVDNPMEFSALKWRVFMSLVGLRRQG